DPWGTRSSTRSATSCCTTWVPATASCRTAGSRPRTCCARRRSGGCTRAGGWCTTCSRSAWTARSPAPAAEGAAPRRGVARRLRAHTRARCLRPTSSGSRCSWARCESRTSTNLRKEMDLALGTERLEQRFVPGQDLPVDRDRRALGEAALQRREALGELDQQLAHVARR